MALGAYDIRFILSVSDRTGNSLRRVGTDMRGVAADAARMKKAFTAMDVGRGLQLRGLLGGAALGVAAQQAADFSTLVTKAGTQVAGNNSLEQIGKNTIGLQKEILNLMGQFPASAQEQADAAYDIFSAMNVPLKQGVGLLKLFNMVAVAGATDLETATNAMITILNNFGGSFDKTMKAVNTSFAIIRFGRLEFSEFNDMLNAVVPSAKAAGQTLEDVSGAMALVTKMIPSQKQGATAISRLLEVLTRSDFRAGAKKMGLSIETATGALKPLPEIIAELARLDISQAEGTINSLFQVVTATGRGGGRGIQSTVQARRALILLVKEFQEYQKVQKGVTGATSEFEKRYTMMIGTAGVKWEKFKANMQALLIMVGAAAIPLFERLGQKVNNAVNWARQNKGMLEFAVKATLVTAAASLLAGTFLKLYGTALILYTGLSRLAGAFGFAAIAARAGAAIGFLGAAFSLLRAHGLKALPVIFQSLAGLSALAKLGVITVTVLVLWKIHKTQGWNEFWKNVDEKIISGAQQVGRLGGPVGASGRFIEALMEADRSVRIKNLQALKDQKNKGKGSNKEVAQEIDNTYKDLVNQVRKALTAGGKDFFNAKMMKAMGLDSNALNEQINNLVNQPPGGTEKQQFANQIAENYKNLMQQASDRLIQVYGEFRSANEQALGNIFEPIEGTGEEEQLRKAWNWTTGADSLLENMKRRVAQFREWRAMLAMLLKKGFSKEFVAEFQKMGPDALKYLDELKSAGPKKVKQFNAVMVASKTTVTKATEIDFNAQIKKWESFGKNSAFAIISGLESEEVALAKRMDAYVTRVYSGVAMAIAREQAKLNFVVPQITGSEFNLSPKAKPAPKGPTKKQIAAAGYEGRYAIPSAATGGLPVAAVQAMGDRYNAMARVYGTGWSNGPPTSWHYTFNVNGTFMSEAEMMDQAMRQAKHKTRNKR